MVDELMIMEESLQNYIDGQVPADNKFLSNMLEGQAGHHADAMPRQEMVFNQAIKLENEICSLRKEAAKVNNNLTAPDSKRAAELVNDAEKKEQIENMEESLGIFYETLKWIESAAVDLKF
jgi:hypothetical protein